MALDAEASITSDSLTAPTEPWMTLSLTSSVDNRSSDSVSASTEPCTSALSTSRSSLTSPVLICWCKPSRVMRVAALTLAFSLSARMVAICRALRSSETATRTSPAEGTPLRPRISTGSDGPADFTLRPPASSRARIRPEFAPTTTASPSFNVPLCTSTVASGPRMVDGLHRLRHDAVVGGHDQDDDVRRLGTPSPHGRERFVTRRVEEGDLAVRRRDLIGPDVLRNAAELLLGDL